MRRPRATLVALSLAALLGLSACGQEAQDELGQFQTENAQVAETEATYMTLDELKYQVQLSRQLNPLLIDDRAYLQGVGESDLELEADEVWFGVWMLVQNRGEEPVANVENFEIRDSQENVYRPVILGPENDFAYRPTTIGADENYPQPNSPAGERPPQAALLLFKVRRFSLDNRPLELVMRSRSGEQAFVSLDV